jgi:hypothetical protein
LKFFFDNCTSPRLASTLHGFIETDGHSAFHVKDLACGRHAPDIEWIKMLGDDNAIWTVVTGDHRILKNHAERAAFRGAGLRGFVLASGYYKIAVHQQASLLLWRWPEMVQILGLLGGPGLFELPLGRSSRIRPLPL